MDKKITVGIFGHTRGGTSAVAGAVRLMGVKMWADDRTSDEKFDLTDELFEKRNKEYGVWGFKFTNAPTAERLENKLRNPHYIFVFRDPIAILSNRTKIFNNRDLISARLIINRLFDATSKCGVPFIVISYERLITDTKVTLHHIADFLGLEVNSEALAYVKHDEGYKDIRRFL